MLQSTRLRYISARTAGALSLAVSSLPFKVEIKGPPVFNNGRWFVWFVLPENPSIKLKNVELKR
jgi:hypothetical protein